MVRISNKLNTTEYNADIPRVGMRMQLPGKYQKLTLVRSWTVGANYVDRKASAFIDLYQSTVSEQYVPYVRPQENGYKTDVDWLALTNSDYDGLLVVCNQPKQGLGMSALHLLNEDFDTTEGLDYEGNADVEPEFRIDGIPEVNGSKHINDIKERDLVQLNIDLGQRGLGGDNSWGARPQKKYMINGNDVHEYSFTMIPLSKTSKEDCKELSKKYQY